MRQRRIEAMRAAAGAAGGMRRAAGALGLSYQYARELAAGHIPSQEFAERDGLRLEVRLAELTGRAFGDLFEDLTETVPLRPRGRVAPPGEVPRAPRHDEAARIEAAASLDKLLSGMSPRYRDVLLRRAAGEPLESIGETYDVTRERIMQVEERAMRRAIRAKLALLGRLPPAHRLAEHLKREARAALPLLAPRRRGLHA